MASTLTLQSVLDWASSQARLAPVLGIGGFTNEPGLSFCNDVLQELLSAPYSWRFNVANLPQFTTIPNQQDYIISGATAQIVGKVILSLNSVSSTTPGLTESGTTVTATYSDFAVQTIPNLPAVGDTVVIAGAALSGYNGSFTITGVSATSKNFTYTAGSSGLANDGGQGVTNISWISHWVHQDYLSSATVQPVHDIEVVAVVPVESIVQPPMKGCFLSENATLSTVTMRMWPIPSAQIWNNIVTYQQKAPLKTDPSNTWSPWPDELGYVLRAGVKYRVLAHVEDPRALNEFQLYQQAVLKALDIKDQEQRHESFFPDRPILYGG